MTDPRATESAVKAAQVEREARRLARVRRLKVVDGGRRAAPEPFDPGTGPKAAA